MARYLGPKCKLSRREGTDLFLKSGVRPLDSKCKLEVPPGGAAQRRECGATAEADDVVEDGIFAHAELFGDVAGDPGAEVAGAGADKQCVDIARGRVRFFQGRERYRRRSLARECPV